MKDDPPSPAELAFCAMLDEPELLAAWAAEARTQWEREHGVEWLHHRDGAPRWLPRRPPLDPDRTAMFRFNPARAAAYAAAKLAAARTGTHPGKRG